MKNKFDGNESNNSFFVISIFKILKFRNIGHSTFVRSKRWLPPALSATRYSLLSRIENYKSWFQVIFKISYIPMSNKVALDAYVPVPIFLYLPVTWISYLDDLGHDALQ